MLLKKQNCWGTTQLAWERIRNFTITYPSNQNEQQAIAEALNDTDALIASEKLIDKKEKVEEGKQASIFKIQVGKYQPFGEVCDIRDLKS